MIAPVDRISRVAPSLTRRPVPPCLRQRALHVSRSKWWSLAVGPLSSAVGQPILATQSEHPHRWSFSLGSGSSDSCEPSAVCPLPRPFLQQRTDERMSTRGVSFAAGPHYSDNESPARRDPRSLHSFSDLFSSNGSDIRLRPRRLVFVAGILSTDREPDIRRRPKRSTLTVGTYFPAANRGRHGSQICFVRCWIPFFDGGPTVSLGAAVGPHVPGSVPAISRVPMECCSLLGSFSRRRTGITMRPNDRLSVVGSSFRQSAPDESRPNPSALAGELFLLAASHRTPEGPCEMRSLSGLHSPAPIQVNDEFQDKFDRYRINTPVVGQLLCEFHGRCVHHRAPFSTASQVLDQTRMTFVRCRPILRRRTIGSTWFHSGCPTPEFSHSRQRSKLRPRSIGNVPAVKPLAPTTGLSSEREPWSYRPVVGPVYR
jgi:hypothetical protein